MPLGRALAVELALRQKPIPRDHPALRSLLEARGACELPPWLLGVERMLPPFCAHFGSAGATGRSLAGFPAPEVALDPLEVARLEDVTTDAERAALSEAVAAWAAGSNGVIEARVFALEGARGAHATADVLRSAGLDSVRSSDATVGVSAVDAASALASLFSAAPGGAYTRRAADARARDLAWASLRTLVGARAGDPVEDVERRALACAFTAFGSTAFFRNVAWDIGLAVVTPERDRLAVLAATDED
jgi:hypothetical protein